MAHSSTTVGDVVSRLLPHGSRERDESPPPPGRGRRWDHVPAWPPDLFAVTASLVELSSSYRIGFPTSDRTDRPFSATWARRNQTLGRRWREAASQAAKLTGVLSELQAEWNTLLAAWGDPITAATSREDLLPAWSAAALRLMAVSDEACCGIGFSLDLNWYPKYRFALVHQFQWLKTPRESPPPATVCHLVPENEACVQPKSLTPSVGCCLRNLSHHLALLPPSSVVRTRWGMRREAPKPGPFNLLVVPYPYHVSTLCWQAGRSLQRERWGRFTFVPRWLDGVSPAEVAGFVRGLVRAATAEVEEVHGVVLPELALTAKHAREVAERLAKDLELELFITGSSDPSRRSNEAFSAIDRGAGRYVTFGQAKHHRWCLDRAQVTRYSLGGALQAEAGLLWWEDIEIPPREVFFHELRAGAAMVALVCEDLARIDPVQRVVRAVGPNLVVALLLDGPQLKFRWPAQYAGVLADDPGSSVLTVTSLGMVLRSQPCESRVVALWREAGCAAQELSLPSRTHALLLTLSSEGDEQRTLDRRSDGCRAVRLRLTGVLPITHPSPPQWTRRPDGA